MRFRTELNLPPASLKIGHKNPILMIGSCFSSSIGQKLLERKFYAMVNPYGTLYTATAILKNLSAVLDQQDISDDHIVMAGERYVCYDMHSDIAANSKSALKTVIKQKRKMVHEWLSKTSVVFITLGTAYHFYHKDLDYIVANCHKQPNDLFSRNISSVTDIVSDLNDIVGLVAQVQPGVQVVFTVSPVRHERDGLIENSRSKSHLLTAVHEVVSHTKRATYFPAYELLIDDLRDYRFYSEDLVHPSTQAIDYIWSYFEDCYMTEETLHLNKRVEKIKRTLNHRPFNPDSVAYENLLCDLKDQIKILEQQHHLDFAEEHQILYSLMKK